MRRHANYTARRYYGYPAYGEPNSDFVANQLNAQELGRVDNGGGMQYGPGPGSAPPMGYGQPPEEAMGAGYPPPPPYGYGPPMGYPPPPPWAYRPY